MIRIRDEILALVREEDAGAPAPGAVSAETASAETVSDETVPSGEASAATAESLWTTDGDEQSPATVLPAGASGADVPRWVRAILRCPDCGGTLRDVDAAMQCESCSRVHPVEGGIPVLIAGRHEAPGAGLSR